MKENNKEEQKSRKRNVEGMKQQRRISRRVIRKDGME
jgi:hypothetical protein